MFRIKFHRKNQEYGFVSLNLRSGKRTFSVELEISLCIDRLVIIKQSQFFYSLLNCEQICSFAKSRFE
jgi:hypothetical protein